MDTIYVFSLYYNEQFLCIFDVGHLSIYAYAADYALTYFTTSKRQLFTLFHYITSILYNVNRTENTMLKSFSIVAYVFVAAGTPLATLGETHRRHGDIMSLLFVKIILKKWSVMV
jgi:hypothetical protein